MLVPKLEYISFNNIQNLIKTKPTVVTLNFYNHAIACLYYSSFIKEQSKVEKLNALCKIIQLWRVNLELEPSSFDLKNCIFNAFYCWHCIILAFSIVSKSFQNKKNVAQVIIAKNFCIISHPSIYPDARWMRQMDFGTFSLRNRVLLFHPSPLSCRQNNKDAYSLKKSVLFLVSILIFSLVSACYVQL